MASFTDLIAQKIQLRRDEFLGSFAHGPNDELERRLAAGIHACWHPLNAEYYVDQNQSAQKIGAVDGSRAVRSLNNGTDWIIAQALLLGPDGLRLTAADTRLLRGDIERPAVDRCVSLLMRSLELELALKFVQDGLGTVLLLDGSLYADLPYLFYSLTIGGYEDLPIKVLEQYLTLFELCQQRSVLLLGIAKSTRSTVLGRTILTAHHSLVSSPSHSTISPQGPAMDVHSLPSDGELLHRWTKGSGLTDPVLLGSASFGHTSARVAAELAARVKQSLREPQSLPVQDRVQQRLNPLQERLLAAPAIGTFYLRLAPGDDILRVDALSGRFGRNDLHLLEFAQQQIPYTAALPIVQILQGDYGGYSVYNAALYVVDREVRLSAETVDHVYLSVLRRQLDYPIQYDRSTRRFIS